MSIVRAVIYFALVTALCWPVAVSAGDSGDIKLEDVDANQDGTVSSEEAKTYLEKLDAEYRQKLENERLRKIQEERLREVSAPPPPAVLHPADINKDGVVSPEEQAAYEANLKPAPDTGLMVNDPPKEMALEEDVPEFLEKKYKRRLEEMSPHDLNKDGILQAEELTKKAESDFGNADMNKDGVLSSDEMAAYRQNIKEESLKTYDSKSQANQNAMKFKNYYQQADKNDDDVVSQEEYEAYFKGRYRKFDRDGNGNISQGEYRSDFEKLPRSYKRDKQKEEDND